MFIFDQYIPSHYDFFFKSTLGRCVLILRPHLNNFTMYKILNLFICFFRLFGLVLLSHPVLEFWLENSTGFRFWWKGWIIFLSLWHLLALLCFIMLRICAGMYFSTTPLELGWEFSYPLWLSSTLFKKE